jgi:hypothetical protein
MDSEEGEISESVPQPSSVSTSIEGEAYNPAYEWPGPGESAPFSSEPGIVSSQHSTRKLRPNQPTFRLLVLRTSILPSKHKLAVIDGYSELQFGRDIAPVGSTIPKLRLKEMEVSKLHATAYWDACRREWGVVDMGSVHGTFLQSANTSVGDNLGIRLSPTRTASIPRTLHHMDRLTIGGTTFLVHMHEERLPCHECASMGGDGLPLFPVKDASSRRSREAVTLSINATTPSPHSTQPQKDAKKALTTLKQTLLTRHEVYSPRSHSAPPGDTATQYLDRSARRRAIHPTSQQDTPGVPSLSTRVNPPPSPPESPKAVTSQPPAPLSTSNIGHRLLMKQGWEPGTSLGTLSDLSEGRIGLVEPLEVAPSVHRAGLGIKRPLASSLTSDNWKESAKRKRWEHTVMRRLGGN